MLDTQSRCEGGLLHDIEEFSDVVLERCSGEDDAMLYIQCT